MIEDTLIDEIREVRKRISNEFNNDPHLLINHYIDMQNEQKKHNIEEHVELVDETIN